MQNRLSKFGDLAQAHPQCSLTVCGILFGASFPIAAVLLDEFVLRPKPLPIPNLIASNPLHAVVLMAPFVLGIVFNLLGREQGRRIALIEQQDASDHTFKLLVNGISDCAIYMLDREGFILNWNLGAERAKGYSESEIVGRHFSTFYSQEDRDAGRPAEALRTALRDNSFETEGWRYRKDGSRFWAQVLVEPVHDAKGDHIGFAKITRDRTEQYESALQIAHLARHDNLTGLPNRSQYLERLDAQLAATGERGKVAVVNIDLDHFKDINDRYGHSVGDRLLRVLASRMSENCGTGELVGRFGGDEFVAFKAFEAEGELRAFVEMLGVAFGEKVCVDQLEILPGASMGIAIFPNDGTDRDFLLNNADLSMYRAKSSVDQKICYYEAGMDDAARDRRALAADLWNAIEGGQFILHYQKQHAVSTEEVTGYEALLRWQHPERGLVSPAVFIPIAEECGAISTIGAWVLETACRQAMQWNIKERISVNVSPVQLNELGFVETIRQTLLKTGLSARRLELEVTETAIVSNKDRALHILRQIKAMGVTIAIDDFGTGYSSLDTLRSFPFDRIKVDRSFVAELENDHRARALLRAMLALGGSLNVSVLAEGVENREQLRILEDEGCNEVQGFLFGRPDLLKKSGLPTIATA